MLLNQPHTMLPRPQLVCGKIAFQQFLPGAKNVGDPWTTWKNFEDIMPSEMSDTKGQILYDATSIRYLEQEIHRQKVESKLPGVGMGVYYFMGIEILLGR